MDRGETEWRRSTLFGERVLGLFRVGGQAERGNQPGQRLFIGLMHDPKRIDVAGRDPDQIGDMAQFVEPAHRASLSLAGPEAGARLMNSAKECARNG